MLKLKGQEHCYIAICQYDSMRIYPDMNQRRTTCRDRQIDFLNLAQIFPLYGRQDRHLGQIGTSWVANIIAHQKTDHCHKGQTELLTIKPLIKVKCYWAINLLCRYILDISNLSVPLLPFLLVDNPSNLQHVILHLGQIFSAESISAGAVRKCFVTLGVKCQQKVAEWPLGNGKQNNSNITINGLMSIWCQQSTCPVYIHAPQCGDHREEGSNVQASQRATDPLRWKEVMESLNKESQGIQCNIIMIRCKAM